MSDAVKGVSPGVKGDFEGEYEYFRYADGPIVVVCDARGWRITKAGEVLAELRGEITRHLSREELVAAIHLR